MIGAGCQIRTIGKISQNVPAKFLEKFGDDMRNIKAGIVLKQTHFLDQHTPSTTPYFPLEFFASLTVRLGVNCNPCWYEINKQNILPIPKTRSHHFSCRLCRLELAFFWRIGILPLEEWSFCFGHEVISPRLINRKNSVYKSPTS